MGQLTGTTFAGLDVRDAVGRDLVSTIYTAAVPDDERMVTLRVVAEDLCDHRGTGSDLYRRFLRRAGAALTFDHPNVPLVEEVGEHHGRGYMVTSHVDSVSLGEYLDEHAPLDIDLVLALFSQIADALDAGHRVGLTHGAVSPSTLRVELPSDGAAARPLLTGFGIGALLELRLRHDRRHLDVVDELRYVAPEQLRQQPLTGRTDQYAMTCALAHALTGAPPFQRDTVGGLFGAHLFVTPSYDGRLPSAHAIRKGLAKEPADRYPTCGQLVAEIEHAERRAVNQRVHARRRHDAVAQRSAEGAEAAAPVATAAAPSRSDGHDAAPTEGGPGYNGDPRREARTEGDPADAMRDVGQRDVAAGTGETTTTDRSADDNSVMRESQAATIAYDADEDESSQDVPPEGAGGDLDDVPLLSEVLSRRSQPPEPEAWRPSWLLVAVLGTVCVALATAAWIVLT